MKKSNPSFSSFEIKTELLFDYSKNQFPTRLWGWDKSLDFKDDTATCYIYIYSGKSVVGLKSGGIYQLVAGQFLSVNEPFVIIGGKGIIIERIGYHGVTLVGGSLESKGRLKYIDGCTDSCILQPVKFGDPCLNALYFPKGIDQTPHTHPSMRVGIVASGSGVCVTPWEEIPLTTGMVFIIHEEGDWVKRKNKSGRGHTNAVAGTHSFRTDKEEMVVVAYHPDSDFGPKDEDHPMINRTIVNGISASKIASIHTK